MIGSTVDAHTDTEGTMIIHPRGTLGTESAPDLRRALVHVLRHVRPARLIVDLHDVYDLDPINVGTLAAVSQLGEDHQVAVFLDYSSTTIAGRLRAAGVATHRLRHVGVPRTA